MIQSIGVIGAGAMGAPMARRLHTAGYDVVICDLNEDSLRAFAAEGLKVTRDARECADVDLVLVLVATPTQVRNVVTGSGGVLAGLTTGQVAPMIGVMSTVGPQAIRELEDSLQGRDVSLLDLPVSGGSQRAEEGTLAMMMAGERRAVSEVRPVLEALGEHILDCGAVGAAQTIKVLNNVIGGINTLLVAETYRVATDHGMSLTEVTRVLDVSTGRNWLSADATEVSASFSRFTNERRSFDSLMDIMRKDFGLAADMLQDETAQYPVVDALLPILGMLGSETYDNWVTVGRARIV